MQKKQALSSPPGTNPSSFFFLRSNTFLFQWRLVVLSTLVVFGMVVVWGVDGCTLKSVLESWRFKQQEAFLATTRQQQVEAFNGSLLHVTEKNETLELSSGGSLVKLPKEEENDRKNEPLELSPGGSLEKLPSGGSLVKLPKEEENERKNEPLELFPGESLDKLPKEEGNGRKNGTLELSPDGFLEQLIKEEDNARWVDAGLEPNFTSRLISKWLAPGGLPCKDSKTVDIEVPGLDGKDLVELPAGEVHELVFQAVDELKGPKCCGGDYFETDLSGDAWKSRPLVKDLGNGSYSVSLQVHPDFAGEYNFTVVLLFRHFEGLKISPSRFVYDKVLRNLWIRFVNRGGRELPSLRLCERSDFDREMWVGRWTRHGKNDGCQIGNDGRYRCLAPDYPCQSPWCNGSLGALESNGWVYSSHCAFRLFSADAAWNCLKNRWIFFWGDSNHVDTIRNMLNFVLELPDVKSVPRRFDMRFSNPRDPSQTVRITSIFNGHWNETQNYKGLNSLSDEGFRDLLKKYFSEETVPDTIIMNSGLHDGVFWSNLRAFTRGADYAVTFWKEIMDSVRQRGLVAPRIFYRTTVATGGYARSLQFNPSKMEVFNWMMLEKLRQAGLLSGVIDNFDMTFPWHFDNRCNDGVHYGRAPLKMKWRDGQIGHQYFVDLMLAHVLLNALCTN